MNSKVFKLGLLVALSCLILVSSVACGSVAPDTQMETANVKQVETANVKQGDIVRQVTADGRLSFAEYRNLTFGTVGEVGQINVSELDRVTEGQVLAKLDTASLERVVEIAELALNSAEIDREQAELGVKAAELSLEQASDSYRRITYPYTYSTFVLDVPQALDYMRNVERQLTDMKKALQVGLTNDQYNEITRQLKDAMDDLTNAQERLARGTGQDVFEQRLLAVKDFWTLRTAQLNMEKAKVALDNAENVAGKAKLAADKARHDLDSARDMLDKAVITAPFDGVIAKVNIKEGDPLSSMNYATTIAIVIVDPSRIELNVKVNELDVPKVKLGQKVTISVDALPDERFESVVTSINLLPDVVGSAVSYEVKVVFDVPQDSALKAGMHATAEFIVG